MILRITALGVVLLAGLAIADDDDTNRAKLVGSWQLADSANAKESQSWSFQEKGDTVHVTNVAGPKTVMDFDCDSMGHDCVVKDNGHSAKMSFYYDGPKLIQMETKGSSTLRRTFVVTGNGDTMDMVQETFAPNPKTETMHFKRVVTANAAH